MTRKNNRAAALVGIATLLGGAVLAKLWTNGYFGDTARASRVLGEMGIACEPEAVLAAMNRNDRHALELLERANVDLQVVDPELGRAPLAQTVVNNEPVLFPFFLQRSGAEELSHADTAGLTALAHALNAPHSHLIDALLGAGAEADILVAEGCPALVATLRAGDLDLADRLLQSGADPDRAATDGEPPVGLAVETKNLPMLQMLLGAGADVDQTDANGRRAYYRASLKDNFADVLPILAEAGADADLDYLGNSPLRLAVLDGDIPRVQMLLQHGATLAKAEWQGTPTLLTHSAAEGRLELSRILLDAGAAVENGGSTESPVRVAWQAGHLPVAELLLDRGAEPGQLHAAALADRDWAMLGLLFEAGQDVDAELTAGHSALVSASDSNDIEMVRFLLENGADPEAIGQLGDRLLSSAVAREQAELVALLLSHGADPDTFVKTPASNDFRKLFRGDENFQHYLFADSKITLVMLAAVKNDRTTLSHLLGAKSDRWVTTKRYKSHALYLSGMRRFSAVQQLLLGREPDGTQPRKILIDLSQQKATFYKAGSVVKSTKVSTGRKKFVTPTGSFVITSKHRDHRSNLYDDAEMPYFLRLSCDAFGLHQGYLPGYPASHGCIRVPKATAKYLFEQTKVGDLVVIRQ